MKPEYRIAEVRKITQEMVDNQDNLDETDIDSWCVLASGKAIKCHNYSEAARIASSFNRCPA